MPPRKRIVATIYLVDCSSNIEEKLQYFRQIYCFNIGRQTKGIEQDIQKIILYTHPNLQTTHKVNNWEIYSIDNLKRMKQQIEDVFDSPKKPLNFLYLIKNAIDDFNSDLVKPNYIKRIIFLTDLSSNMEFNDIKLENQIKYVNELLTSNDILLYMIGVNVKIAKLSNQSEILKLNKFQIFDELSTEKKVNYNIMKKLDNTIFADFQHGLSIVFSHHVNRKPPFLTYHTLNIGINIQIPVSIHQTTSKKSSFVSCKRCPLIEGNVLSKNKSWYDINTHEVVPVEYRVKGYKFHKRFVHISDEQFMNAEQVQTEKCLNIVLFIKAEEFPVKFYAHPYKLYRIAADKRNQSEEDCRFELFVESLRIKNVVALGYKVYSKGAKRQFICIYPCKSHQNCSHLFLVQLHYEHELRELFVKGKIEEETKYKSDTYPLITKFLNELTPFDSKVNQELYPLPVKMCVCQSRVRAAEVLAQKVLEEEIKEPPNLDMHPVLKSRISDLAAELSKLCESD